MAMMIIYIATRGYMHATAMNSTSRASSHVCMLIAIRKYHVRLIPIIMRVWTGRIKVEQAAAFSITLKLARNALAYAKLVWGRLCCLYRLSS